MKKFGILAVLLMIFSGLLTAQEDHKYVSGDFEAWVDHEFQFDFRKMVDDVLQLEDEQMREFNMIYLDYLKDQVALAKRQHNLLDEYQEEMKEDDTKKDEDGETADFIEDYWEVSIDQSDLRKEYFDRLEDAIGWEKAFNFFLLENDVRSRLHSVRVYKIFPEIDVFYKGNGYGATDKTSSQMETSSMTDTTDASMSERKSKTWNYNKSDQEAYSNTDGKMVEGDNATKGVNVQGVDAYNAWYEEKGSMSLDHDYTYTGINRLVAAIEDVENRYEKVRDTDSFADFEEEVTALADKLTVKPLSDQHADAARKAFQLISNRIVEMERACGEEDLSNSDAVVATADDINADELLLDQNEDVKRFFKVAGTAVNELVRHMDAKPDKATNNK